MGQKFVVSNGFVPFAGTEVPSFGVISTEGVVQIVLPIGFPDEAGDVVLSDLGSKFLVAIVPDAEVSSRVFHVLQGMVVRGQLRWNSFTKKWMWLGTDATNDTDWTGV